MTLRPLALLLAMFALCGPVSHAVAQDVYRTSGQWLDDQSRPFNLATLHGSLTVLTMAYGACRRICSTSLRTMQQVQALADQRHLTLNFVVLGLDPTQDKPADWAAFRAEQKLGRANWMFLTSDEAGTRNIARQLGIQYWRYGEHTMHDFKIVLVAPDGKVLHAMQAFDDDLALLLP